MTTVRKDAGAAGRPPVARNLRSGEAHGYMGPMRTCVGCRASSAQDRLLRYGLSGGQVVPALGARPRIGGRSAYLCPRRPCLDQAIKRRALARALGAGGRSSGRRVKPNDQRRGPALGMSGEPAADALWTATIDLIRREIELLERSARNPHAHLRRRGLERLLFELSSQPAPSDRRQSGQGGCPTHG